MSASAPVNRAQALSDLMMKVHIDIDAAKADMDDTFNEIRKLNQIKLKEAEIRNVIFVGRSRVGKSTALQVLKDPTFTVKRGSLYSDPANAKIFPFTVEDVQNVNPNQPEGSNNKAVCYNINIIDTPGLFEVKSNKSEEAARDDEQIEKIITQCMEHEITKLHCIFFVCNFTTGVNRADIKAFERFLKIFQGAEGAIAMLITNAESYTDATKKGICDELAKHKEMSEFMEKFGNRVFFSGSISDNDCQNNLADAIKTYSVNVMQMRKKVYDYIFNECKEPFQLTDLTLFKADKMKCDSLKTDIDKLQKEIDSLSEESARKQVAQEEKEKLLEQLSKAKSFIMNRIGEQQARQSLSAVKA